MTVRELMTTVVYFVKEDGSAKDAMELMRKNDIGSVPVCSSNGEILGIITDRDILMKCASEPCDLSAVPVAELMSHGVITLSPEMNIHDAACIFSKNKKRRLPVAENSKLIGMLSISDLAKKRVFLAEVGEIMGALSR